jgi:hypothetical protein
MNAAFFGIGTLNEFPAFYECLVPYLRGELDNAGDDNT